MDATVNPWEVKGSIDYDKLISQFGLQKMGELPAAFNDFLLFRRGIIFAHRDFNRITEAYTKGKPFVMMTGLMPTGKLHLGHKMVIEQIIFYQKLGAKVYVTVADVEAYNSRSSDLQALHDNAFNEYLLNYVAMGLDLEKVDFYFQSARSQDGKKSNAYYALAKMLARHATFNEFKAVYGDITPSKMASSLLQASDMLHAQLPEFEGGPCPVIIPVGTDQDPHIRLCRDISQRMKLHDFIQISSTCHLLMPALKGPKMSSSDPTSFIALTDTPEEAERKIKKYAFSGGRETLEEHREKGGNPDIDVAFQMLKFGFEPDDAKLQQIADEYRAGKLLSGELKAIAIEKVKSFLTEHHKKREAAKPVVEAFRKKLGF